MVEYGDVHLEGVKTLCFQISYENLFKEAQFSGICVLFSITFFRILNVTKIWGVFLLIYILLKSRSTLNSQPLTTL